MHNTYMMLLPKTSVLETEIEQIRESSRTLVRELGFLQRTFGKSGLTPGQGHILLEIDKVKSMAQDRLAGMLNLNQSTTSRNLKVLIQHQLVQVTKDPQDQRTKLLSLTTKGVSELKFYHEDARKDVACALEFLTKEQRQQCLRGLQLYALALKKANLKKGSYHQLQFRFPTPDNITSEKIVMITNLINQVYDEAESGMWKHLGTRTTVQEIERLLKQKALILAELDGTIVGSVNVTLIDSNVGEFGMLMAHPDYQGIGIGSGLVHAAEEWAKNLKCTTMQLNLLTPRSFQHPRKELLKKWYSRLGYQPQNTEPFEQLHPHEATWLAVDCDFTVWQKRLT